MSDRGLLPLKLAWQLLIRELIDYSLRDMVLNFVRFVLILVEARLIIILTQDLILLEPHRRVVYHFTIIRVIRRSRDRLSLDAYGDLWCRLDQATLAFELLVVDKIFAVLRIWGLRPQLVRSW